jgi:hypothetical protein
MPTHPLTHPLTHHEILGLVAPYARRGRQVDLQASDRLQRRLLFKPVEHAAALQETLELDDRGTGRLRLTRVLTRPDGLAARLQAEGGDAAELLARIEAVPIERGFAAGPGWALGLCHRLEAAGGDMQLLLTEGQARAGGLLLAVQLGGGRGAVAEFTLQGEDGEKLDLPEDLLAVLGWPWSRLMMAAQGWRGHLRLARKEPARSRQAEAELARAAAHLARTLAEPPARFHERLRGARWGVTLRRGVPLLGCIALIAGTASLPRFDLAQDSVFRMLIFHFPPLLLIAFFCLREMPRIEIPPLPRRLTAAAWRQPPP